jgi:hypothetical protein
MLTAHVQEEPILRLFCNPNCNTRSRRETCQKRRISPWRKAIEKQKKNATKKHTTRMSKIRKRKIRQRKNKSRRKETNRRHCPHVRRSQRLDPAQKDMYLSRP